MTEELIPDHMDRLLKHCLQYGFLDITQKVYNQHKQQQPLFGRGVYDKKRSRLPIVHVSEFLVGLDLCRPCQVSAEAVQGAFLSAFKWLMGASTSSELKDLKSDLHSFDEKQIVDLVCDSVEHCWSQTQKDAADTASWLERLASFEDVVIAAVLKKDNQRRTALAVRFRSENGGPLVGLPGLASTNPISPYPADFILIELNTLAGKEANHSRKQEPFDQPLEECLEHDTWILINPSTHDT